MDPGSRRFVTHKMCQSTRQRYFSGKSQRAVGQRLGISQMHVSRLERWALARLRTVLREALKARDVMTKRVYTVPEETRLPELAEMMLTRRVNRVPVVREGRLVGIVSRGDLVRALAEQEGTAQRGKR